MNFSRKGAKKAKTERNSICKTFAPCVLNLASLRESI